MSCGFNPPRDGEGKVIPAGVFYLEKWKNADARVKVLEEAIREHVNADECGTASLQRALDAVIT